MTAADVFHRLDRQQRLQSYTKSLSVTAAVDVAGVHRHCKAAQQRHLWEMSVVQQRYHRSERIDSGAEKSFSNG